MTEFVEELRGLYPQFWFREGKIFKYRPGKTIFLGPMQPNYGLLTLHELGHALCNHKDYKTLIQRLKIESEAWERAKTVLNEHPEWLKKYKIEYDEDFVEEQLDTYRDWLHRKTLCKDCGLTCYQTADGRLHCPSCEAYRLM